MSDDPGVRVYIDYKSPYAYLAKDLTYAVEDAAGTAFDWFPYTLDIPSYLGSAELDEAGRVVSEQRNAHQWRRVRYSYMDCRREARKRGLTILGTRRIWNSTLAGIGMLFAKRQGKTVLRAYNDIVFERFWRRDLDIEDDAVLTGVLAEAGAAASGFAAYLDGEGRQELAEVQRDAETMGVFGVPTFVIDGEIFWGREHLPEIASRLRERAGPVNP